MPQTEMSNSSAVETARPLTARCPTGQVARRVAALEKWPSADEAKRFESMEAMMSTILQTVQEQTRHVVELQALVQDQAKQVAALAENANERPRRAAEHEPLKTDSSMQVAEHLELLKVEARAQAEMVAAQLEAVKVDHNQLARQVAEQLEPRIADLSKQTKPVAEHLETKLNTEQITSPMVDLTPLAKQLDQQMESLNAECRRQMDCVAKDLKTLMADPKLLAKHAVEQSMMLDRVALANLAPPYEESRQVAPHEQACVTALPLVENMQKKMVVDQFQPDTSRSSSSSKSTSASNSGEETVLDERTPRYLPRKSSSVKGYASKRLQNFALLLQEPNAPQR